jgi:transaldolase
MDEVLELAGCDRLTISPAILQELKSSDIEVPRKLHPFQSDNVSISKLSVDEPSFRFALNEDAMATEKLSEGIRQFSSDLRKLEEVVIEKLNKYKH